VRTLAVSLAPPVVAGYFLERPIEEQLGGANGLSSGLVLGAVALTVADRLGGVSSSLTPREETRNIPARVGVALGLTQAAALWPGVSRTGATLAAARALGYSRPDASRLSFGVAGPVLAGATALKAWRGRRDADLKLLATGTAAAFAGTATALKLLGLERRRPLWPYAAERVLLAGAMRYGRAR
jgi:undecaprenyl-diphosphatase